MRYISVYHVLSCNKKNQLIRGLISGWVKLSSLTVDLLNNPSATSLARVALNAQIGTPQSIEGP